MLDQRTFILCYDSGIGGLSYLPQLQQRLPSRSFLYFADNLNFPFGEKHTEALRKSIVHNIGQVLERYHIPAVILLCNTASINALDALRKSYPETHFIGTVPAIKPAAELSVKRSICMLATKLTSQAEYIHTLHQNFAADCEVTSINAGTLVDYIEEELYSSQPRSSISKLQEYLPQIIQSRADFLVLGCTHFLHLEAELQQILPPSIKLCDSREGVSRQLERVIPQNSQESLESNSPASPKLILLLSKDCYQSAHWQFWMQRFSLEKAAEQKSFSFLLTQPKAETKASSQSKTDGQAQVYLNNQPSAANNAHFSVDT